MIDKVFPTVHICDSQQSLFMDDTLNNTTKTLIALLRDNPDRAFYLSTLERHTRKKIEPYLADKVLSLDKSCVHNVYSLAISYEK